LARRAGQTGAYRDRAVSDRQARPGGKRDGRPDRPVEIQEGAMPEPYSYRRDSAVPAFADDRPVILFDGYCALCSGWVSFVLRHDRAAAFRLLPAQTDLGTALYRHYGLDAEDYQTNILIADGRAFFKSESAIRMLERLGAPWSAARVLRLLPVPLRDWLYDIVARNRLRWFGRRDQCLVSAPRYEDRFLA
jgi:predicted DCC family thiol-disulfide oxidoreductase YuxK